MVHALGPATVDHPTAVAHDGIFRRHAHGLEQRERGHGSRAGAVDDDAHVAEAAAGELERVDQPGGGDDRRAMLVVVHDRHIEVLAQTLFDDEALRRLDVFEVDATERRGHDLDGFTEAVHVFGVEFEVDTVDIGEALEQHRLAFHHGLGGQRPEIAQPQHGCAVGNDRHGVGLGGIVVGAIFVFGDAETRVGNAGRVGQRKVSLCRQRLGSSNFELAGSAAGMQEEGFAFRNAVDVLAHKNCPLTPDRDRG